MKKSLKHSEKCCWNTEPCKDKKSDKQRENKFLKIIVMETPKKFFKIVNPNGHYGMIYKEGYNEDPLPFNPKGDCEAGGIYFASEDIFAFIDYGTEVYEVEPVGEIYENPGAPKKFKAHAVNLKYIGKIDDIKTIAYLISNGANIHANNDYALRRAAENGRLEIIKYLVERGADIHAGTDYSLRWAAYKGHLEIVKYLVEKGADINAINKVKQGI